MSETARGRARTPKMNQLGCTAATFRRLLLLVAVVGLLVATVEAKKKPNKYGDGDFEFVDEVRERGTLRR